MREGWKRRHVGVAAAVLLLGSAGSAVAQSPIGGFVSLGVGIRQPSPSTLTRTAVSADGLNREEAKTTTQLDSSGVVDVGGGIVLANRFTIGAAFERSSSKQPADLTLSLSHPQFHPTITGTEKTGDLKRTDSALHLQFGYRVISMPSFTLTAFGGPSYMTTRHHAVSDVSWDEPFNPVSRTFSVRIDEISTDSIKGSAWGYNVGADGSYFLSKYVGIGGMVRYSRATIDLENPLQSMVEDRTVSDPVKTGGWTVTGGLRLRF